MCTAEKCVAIETFENFITEVLNVNENFPTNFPQKFISYRGQSDVDYVILPAIGRKGERHSV